MKPPKVTVRSAFVTSEGKFKCAGTLSELPMNPWAEPEFPVLRVNLNGRWETVQIIECHPSYGWTAEALDALEHTRGIAPKVELRRNGVE